MSLGAHHQLFGYEVDTEAIYRGAFAITAISVPLAAVLGRLVDDDSAWAIPITVAVFASFVLGGAISGHMRPETPALHGALAAVPCLVVLAAIRVFLTIVSDTELGLLVIISQFVIGTSLAMFGGILGARFSRRPRSLVR